MNFFRVVCTTLARWWKFFHPRGVIVAVLFFLPQNQLLGSRNKWHVWWAHKSREKSLERKKSGAYLFTVARVHTEFSPRDLSQVARASDSAPHADKRHVRRFGVGTTLLSYNHPIWGFISKRLNPRTKSRMTASTRERTLTRVTPSHWKKKQCARKKRGY